MLILGCLIAFAIGLLIWRVDRKWKTLNRSIFFVLLLALPAMADARMADSEAALAREYADIEICYYDGPDRFQFPDFLWWLRKR